MPWKESSVVDERLKFVADHSGGRWSKRALCPQDPEFTHKFQPEVTGFRSGGIKADDTKPTTIHLPIPSIPEPEYDASITE